MYRLLEESGQPTKQQTPARASANRAALEKGRPAGNVCERRGGTHHRPSFAGRPV